MIHDPLIVMLMTDTVAVWKEKTKKYIWVFCSQPTQHGHEEETSVRQTSFNSEFWQCRHSFGWRSLFWADWSVLVVGVRFWGEVKCLAFDACKQLQKKKHPLHPVFLILFGPFSYLSAAWRFHLLRKFNYMTTGSNINDFFFKKSVRNLPSDIR